MKLRCKNDDLGVVGDLTSLVDVNRIPLCIGDTVLLFNIRCSRIVDEMIICKCENKAFPMGVEATDFINGTGDNWIIYKHRDHTEFKVGDKLTFDYILASIDIEYVEGGE